MTVETTNNREKARRLADLWDHRPNASLAEVEAEIEAAMADEAEARALRDQHTAALMASYDLMLRCPCCQVGNTLGNPTGLCADCGRVLLTVRNERAGVEEVNGHTRRELVETYLDKIGG
jgi:hypothetical protein